MARKDIAAVLDAQLTLDLTFNQVAPCAEDGNNKTKAHPLNERERGFVARNYRSYRHGKQSTANAAYPRLLGRDAGEELIGYLPAQKRTNTISPCLSSSVLSRSMVVSISL